MKLAGILFAATGYALLAGTALAQDTTAPAPPAPAAQAEPAPPVAGEAPPPAMDEPAPPAVGDKAPPKGDKGPRSRGPRGEPPVPPPSKAASFRIEVRGNRIEVQCAEDEPTKVCADVLTSILDRAGPGFFSGSPQN